MFGRADRFGTEYSTRGVPKPEIINEVDLIHAHLPRNCRKLIVSSVNFKIMVPNSQRHLKLVIFLLFKNDALLA